jgi:D-arabinose 1-dehydrogenase-like Zn-dependent alcohol dehydrogenase
LQKALRVQGPPIITHECLSHTLNLVEKHKIRAPVKKYRFDQNEVNEAWKTLEEGHTFEAPLIVFQQ